MSTAVLTISTPLSLDTEDGTFTLVCDYGDHALYIGPHTRGGRVVKTFTTEQQSALR